MTRTSARATALSDLLTAAGFQPAASPPAPRLEAIAPPHVDALIALYRRLGGMQDSPKLRPGGWDLCVEAAGGVALAVELDEELHFNRYREQTLSAAWYRDVPWASEYTVQCKRHEPQCLRAGTWGKRWTTPSCEQLFGDPGPAGQLAGHGAPRWKQRALYDAIKDLAALLGSAPRLARLSIYDQIAGRPLEAYLTGSVALDPAPLRNLVEQRTIGATRCGSSSMNELEPTESR